LNVYIKANDLVIGVYDITKRFPKEELFGLVSQMRRCAISVVANIAEGYGKNTKKDKLNFCYISRGSLTEIEYYIDLSYQLKYISKDQFFNLKGKRDEVGRLLFGYMRSLAK